MRQHHHSRARRLALAAGALTAIAPFAGGSAVASAAAALATCKKPAKVVASKYGNYLFRKGTSLWACTAYYGDPPRTVRLGPWSQGFSRASFDGSTALWTVAGPTVEGVPTARIWAADAPMGKAWMKGLRPTLPGTAVDDADAVVPALKAMGQAVAWVTGNGAVFMGVQDPNGGAPTPIGAGTPAAAPTTLDGVAQGLADPLVPRGHRLFVGRWSGISPVALGKTIKLVAGQGDGDECGGASPWLLTVVPASGQPPVGATWDSDWTSSSNACRGL